MRLKNSRILIAIYLNGNLVNAIYYFVWIFQDLTPPMPFSMTVGLAFVAGISWPALFLRYNSKIIYFFSFSAADLGFGIDIP